MSPTTRAQPPEPVGRDAHGPRARLQLPQERPNHLLGIADLRSIAKCVPAGVDTFDSAFPSRNGRHGSLLSDAGVIKIGNAKYAHMHEPVMPSALQCDAASSMPLRPARLRLMVRARRGRSRRTCRNSLPRTSTTCRRSAAPPSLPSLGRARTLLLLPPPPCSAALRIRRSCAFVALTVPWRGRAGARTARRHALHHAQSVLHAGTHPGACPRTAPPCTLRPAAHETGVLGAGLHAGDPRAHPQRRDLRAARRCSAATCRRLRTRRSAGARCDEKLLGFCTSPQPNPSARAPARARAAVPRARAA